MKNIETQKISNKQNAKMFKQSKRKKKITVKTQKSLNNKNAKMLKRSKRRNVKTVTLGISGFREIGIQGFRNLDFLGI